MTPVINQSTEHEWTEDGLTYTEMVKQEYGGNNCKFSAGFVEGHPIDTLYLRLEKDGVEPTMLLFRPDEVAAIAWCCTGVLWSHHMNELPDEVPADQET